jgi:hypothetical protein
MLQLTAATAVHQAADATDAVTNFFLLLAAGLFVAVLLRLAHAGELGNVITTVGSVIGAVVVITVIALVLFIVLVALRALLTF